MFFFPFSDDNPTQERPHLSYILLAICVLVFFWQISLSPDAHRAAIVAYGMIPARLFGFALPYHLPYEIPAFLTLISSMFLHGGFMHLAGNMLYLWIFSDNVEDCIGRGKFLIFYLLCGIVAALSQAFVNTQSPIPMIGASGAIAGVLGAYLMLYPRANIKCLLIIFFFFRFVNVPAYLVLGGWIILQFFSLGQTSSNVAYVAHIGGFIAGMVLVLAFKKPDVKLFSKPHSRAFTLTPLHNAPHIPRISRKRKHPWDF